MKTANVSLVLSLMIFGNSFIGQSGTKQSNQGGHLIFRAVPTKHVFAKGEDIAYMLTIRNVSVDPVFVSTLASGEFVDFKICGPGGEEVRWKGRGRIDSKTYSPSDFAVLKSQEQETATRIISVKNDQGFIIDKPGRYTVTAEYSLSPPEYFAPLAGGAKIPSGTFRARVTDFCVESCVSN
jgi:hypothetical protein